MRTTITIDPDVEVLLKTAVNQQQKTLDEVLNDTLRQALPRTQKRQREPYVLKTRPLGIKAELDKAVRLSDELEDEEIIGKLGEGR